MGERESLAEVIWKASRADEGTISATGANVVADAVLAAGYRPQGGDGREIEQSMLRNAARMIESLTAQIAERDAVIERVRDAVDTGAGDGWCVVVEVDDIIKTAPASTLAKVKAQVLEEVSWERLKSIHNPAQMRDHMRARAAEYRKENNDE